MIFSAAVVAVQKQIEIVPVDNRAQMRRFIEFQYTHYRGDRYWVPPLRADQRDILDHRRHPFYQHADLRCYLAFSDGQVCGRIAAIFDRAYNEGRDPKVGAFGFYESVDSQSVANALFKAASTWLAERGATVIRGPVSPSINYEVGLLVDGFDSSPAVMMAYNPPYYVRLFEGVGLQKARDLYAYRLTHYAGEEDKKQQLLRAARVYSVPGLRIRCANPSDFDHEMESVWHIHSSAWRGNWGAAPMSIEEARHMGRHLKSILDPKLALFAEIGDQAVAFALVVPDINVALKHANGSLFPFGLFKILYYKSKIKKVRVLALGVKDGYRASGTAAQMYLTLAENAVAMGYTEAECSWVVEDNRAMNRTLEFIGAKRYKTYRVYEMR